DETSSSTSTPTAPAPDVQVEAAITQPTLTGHARIAADTYAPGPTSGQFISGGDLTTATATYHYSLPLLNEQPVQGISAMAKRPVEGTFYVMPDNGFGGKPASPDALLRIYAVRPDWDNGRFLPVNAITGAALSSFTSDSFISLRDPDHKLGFALVADGT